MIGQTLLNYRITEKLGEGGQGTVYKALDTKLERTVVLKLLSPELVAKKVNLARFEREAKLASSLDHPNICTIYGLHEVGGVHFIVMQYVEGRNVRQLVDGRALDLESAISIAAQVTEALTAAHARGVIHRDVKAGNVMVTDAGLVKVLDFGLAKLLEEHAAQSGGGDVHLTELGVPYGTATYAAPEQAQGALADHRADVFSTGVLLYELLTGTWPFQGKNTVEVRYAVLHDAPRPLVEARPAGERSSVGGGGSNVEAEVVDGLQRVLDRAMAKNPRDRYQQMASLRDDLRRAALDWRERKGQGIEGGTQATSGSLDVPDLMPAPAPPRHQAKGGVAGTLRRWLRSLTGAELEQTSVPGVRGGAAAPRRMSAVVADTAATSASIHETPHQTQEQASQSIAILPFHNLSGDREIGFYEFSLADAVITDLARVRSLVVRPSSLIVKYQGQQVDPVEAGRELSVSAVLASSFLRVGDRLRVTTQLVEVASGSILWSDRIDAATLDLIALQDTIARHIVDGLRLELTTEEQDVIGRPATSDAAAYEEYLRGRDAMGRFIYHSLSYEDSQAAIEHFMRAIALDSNFALAHCALGGVYANRVIKGLGDKDDYERAESEFNLALASDAHLIEARMHMVFIHLSRGEKAAARREVEQLHHESPNDVGVYFVKGTLHRLSGEYPEALHAFNRMLRLNPAERVVVSYNRARIFMYQRRFEDAMLELDLGSTLEPDHPLIKTFRARLLYYMGEAPRGARLLEEILQRQPKLAGIRPILAMCLSAQGEHEAARRELDVERVRENAAVDHDISYWLASAWAVEGEREEAFHWLERSIALGNENRTWFESDPNWAALRDDQQFKRLMRGIGNEAEPNRNSQSASNTAS